MTASITAPKPYLKDFLDYREYLKAFYNFKKESSVFQIRSYSYAVFAASADIKSPNYLKMIMDGKRNLSDDMISKFAKGLQLNKDEAEEFRILVQFTQSSEPAIRNQYLRELSEYRVTQQLKVGSLDEKTIKKIPTWVGWILYALVDQEGAQFSITQLKTLLRGKAAESEIQEALDQLLSSGELTKDETTGLVTKTRSLIENPEDVPVVLIGRLQGQLMYLGLESLYQDPPTEREFGTLTLALTKQEFESIRFQLRKLRKEINKDLSTKRSSSKGERVYQLNLQLFPVTEKSNAPILGTNKLIQK